MTEASESSARPTLVEPPSEHRAPWRAVAIPREHGGWGLTLEPVLLGLLVAWSWPGVLIGVVAFGSFLVRTPLKVVAVDLRRSNWRRRTKIGMAVAAAELILIAGAAILVSNSTGFRWLIPLAVAAPLIAVEAWYDVRSRSRRLVPELCGAVGIGAVSASIVIAGDGESGLAWAVWLVLAARSLGSIPFVRAQIARVRRGDTSTAGSDAAQVVMIAVAVAAVAVDAAVIAGASTIVVLAVVQAVAVRRTPHSITRLGVGQMVVGLAIVATTSAGIALA